MVDFSHLSRMQVTGDKTARFTIYEITLNGEYPTLIVKPAGEANKPYFNAMLKRASKNRRAIQAGAVNAGMIAENRNDDRELFPEYVVVGWEGVTDSAGEPVQFGKDNCKDFVKALPDHVFDGVRHFSADMSNFAEVADTEADAKN